MEGILNILKPPGMSSHDVVARMRRITGQRKIGHSGTLDPGAAGVLPVFLGKATRLIEYGIDWDKAYRVELTFGGHSSTGDDSSPIIWEKNPCYPTREEVIDVLSGFVGIQLQIPPMYSALKVNGRKLYELAREGKTIEREPRTIEISSIKLLDYQPPILRFDVSCSKGTYIRTLCEDIAAQLGLSAVMTFLLRTRVGEFCIDQCELPDESIKWNTRLHVAEDAVRHFPEICLSNAEAVKFCFGQRIELIEEKNKMLRELVRVTNGEILIGIGKVVTGNLMASKVLHDLRKQQ